MLILKTPKGWTGPKFVDGKPVEGTWRAHQVPFSEIFEKPDHLRLLDEWMRSYKPEELFDEKGHFRAELADLAPKGAAAHGDECPRQRRPAAEAAHRAQLPRF
jgi:xylulose-5-phosphate/fructose-6-phosphate phosphoketolase